MIGFLSTEPSLRDGRRQRASAYQPRAQRSDALGVEIRMVMPWRGSA